MILNFLWAFDLESSDEFKGLLDGKTRVENVILENVDCKAVELFGSEARIIGEDRALYCERLIVLRGEQGEKSSFSSSRGPHDGEHLAGFAVAWDTIDNEFILSFYSKVLPGESDLMDLKQGFVHLGITKK